MNAIPTMYKGIEYRSRLEARWASFFTNLGWEHTYEPMDGHGYIPDFLLQGEMPVLIEVKPAATIAEYREPIDKIEAGLRGLWAHDYLIVGLSPTSNLDDWSGPAIGMLGEYLTWDGDEDGWTCDPGIWITCLECQHPSFFHSIQSYTSRICGHGHGDHYKSQPRFSIADLWAEACNDVKWRGRPA